MGRLILLNFRAGDVDVLSRVPRDAFSEVMVVHTDPRALVLKLAVVAQLSTHTDLPTARADDVVAAPDIPEVETLLHPWRELHARILEPQHIESAVPAEVGASASGAAARTREESPPPAQSSSESPAAAERAPVDDSSTDKEPATMTTPYASPSETAPSTMPPSRVWESPEATFRYLLNDAAKSNPHQATLWWDGDEGAWVPWLWTGEQFTGTTEDLEQGVEIPCSWGRFRLLGVDAFREELNVPALSRVAEDLALRDLMTWRKESGELSNHGRPDPHGDTAALSRWAEPVFRALGARAALIWKRTAEGWRLLVARGDGLGVSGELLFPETLMTSTFEHAGGPWSRWDPGEGFRAYMTGGAPDPRLPLRLKRMEHLLASGGGRP